MSICRWRLNGYNYNRTETQRSIRSIYFFRGPYTQPQDDNMVETLMEIVYVARQPIFDKNKNIYAYELLFRDGTANYVPDIDGDVATTTLLANTFFTIGMDTLAGGRKSFINFTQNLLEKKVPLLLPKETTVIEILEDVKPSPPWFFWEKSMRSLTSPWTRY